MQRFSLCAAGLSGFLAVMLGAFGAHGLRTRFEALPDAAKRLEWWSTASHYHLAHALALGLVGVLAGLRPGVAPSVAVWAFLVGTVLFSGSLYVMSLTGVRVLGAVTPFGGLAFLVGWLALAWAAFKLPAG